MTEKIDIYQHDAKHKAFREKLEQSILKAKDGIVELENQTKKCKEFISVRNVELILGFDTAAGLEGMSKCRRNKYFSICKILVLQANKDFDKLALEDVQKIVLWIDEKPNPWTRQMFKVILKKFIKYVTNPQGYLLTTEYPDIVKWIKPNIRKKDRPKIPREQLLTEEEILRGIQAAENAMEKALFALQSETGCRIGELGNMRIKDLIAENINPRTNEKEYFVRLNGKTGERVEIIFYSVHYILEWLNQHPKKDDVNSPFWIAHKFKNEVKPARYQLLRRIVIQTYAKAVIKKIARSHYLRHSRATIDLKRGISDSIAKKRFGWVDDTKQLATYSHLVDEDVHDQYRQINNKGQRTIQEPLLTVKVCYKCKTENPVTNDFCKNCCTIISVQMADRLRSDNEIKAQQMEVRLQSMEQTLRELAQKLPAPVPLIYQNNPAMISVSGLQTNQQFIPFIKNEVGETEFKKKR